MHTVLIRTYLNQAVKRYLDGEESGKARIKVALTDKEVWLCDKEQVYAYDDGLFDQMRRYDAELDSDPVGLAELWSKAVPVFANSSE